MPRDPLAGISTVSTPQRQPVPGRTDQVKNSAGGYVFRKDDMTQLEDFLILGTTGGSYYLDESKLTQINSDLVLRLARERGTDVVAKAVEISTAVPPRAPRNQGCLFALAAVSAFGDPEAVQAVKAALPKVARTTDHLSKFFGYRKQLKGKQTGRGLGIKSSRAFKATMLSFLLDSTADDVAFRACKAMQRKTPAGEAFSYRDIMRIARPDPKKWDLSSVNDGRHVPRTVGTSDPHAQRAVLFDWLSGAISDEVAARSLPAVDRFNRAKSVKTPAEAIRVVTEHRVPWEFLPSSVLSDKGVWEALTETIGMTALIRNLARMTRIGTLAPFAEANKVVIRRLTDSQALAKGRIHPIDIYLALRVYAGGFSQPNPKADAQRWDPVPGVQDALEEAYHLAFGYTQPSGRRWYLAVDSSGSMTWSQPSFSGAKLGSSYNVANAIALTMKRIEGENAHVIDVDTRVHASKVTARMRLGEIMWRAPSGGGTDLSLPFQHAQQQGHVVDGFLVLTDNETWAGGRHPFQALSSYRSALNPAARAVVASMVPNTFSIMEQDDPGVLNMAGLDASLPQVATSFLRGE